MKFVRDVTRGGQIGYHFLNMFRQVNEKFKYPALLMGLLIGCYCVMDMPKVFYLDTANYYNASLVKIMGIASKKRLKVDYLTESGRSETRFVDNVLNSWSVQNNKAQCWEYLKTTGWFCLGGVVGLYIFVMVGFHYLGVKQRTKTITKGATFLDEFDLIKKLKREGIASQYKIGDLPLVEGSETSHIFITGTTGSGKSNCIKSLVLQVRKENQKAIIIDTSGEYLSGFYDSTKDTILNPYDERSANWDMWRECGREFELDSFVNVLFPKKHSGEDFWVSSAKMLFKSVFEKVAKEEKRSYARILQVISGYSLKELHEFLKGTESANLLESDEKSDNATARSIRSTAIPYVKFLKHLQEPTAEKSCTIQEWVDNTKKGFLFISCTTKQRDTMRSLFTAWTDITTNSLMDAEMNEKNKTFFVIDELASLGKLPSLRTSLAEGRKYGICCVIGTQSVPDVHEIYGHHLSQSLLNNFNTKVFFRCLDPSTQQWIVNALGKYEEDKPVENYSYGANTIRDGVSITTHTREKTIILNSELSQLDNLEAFVQLPKGLPITKIKMEFTELPKIATQEKTEPQEAPKQKKINSKKVRKNSPQKRPRGKIKGKQKKEKETV